MRKFNAFKRIATGILGKWLWAIGLVFLLLSILFSAIVVWKVSRSSNRFDAVTRIVYNPRQVAQGQTISDKQLLSILDRGSLKRRVGKILSMPETDRQCLVSDLKIVQERKPTNVFTLTARASSWVGAVRKVNAYANVLISEYVSYRTADLINWQESLELRKRHLQEQVAALDGEESVVKGKSGVVSPLEALMSLNSLISDQRRNQSMLCVQMGNEEVKKKRLETAVGEMGDAIIACAPVIRKKSAELQALDEEISKLREVYTDLNPKVRGKLDDRQELMEEYLQVLKNHGIEGVNVEDVEKVEASARELADVIFKIEVLGESQRSLEHEIKENEARSEALTAIIPQLERIKVKRDEFNRGLSDIEEQIGSAEYLRMTAENDLKQLEKSGGAGDKGPLSVQNFIIGFVGAGVCTFVLTMWIIALEMVFGKMRGAKELAAWDDVRVIGSLPAENKMSSEMEKDVMGVLALNFCNAPTSKGVVLICRLAGAPYPKKFAMELDWSLSMAGQRVFSLNVVQAAEFAPEEGGEMMINTLRKGETGWFSVANRYMLAPTEIQMLQADIMTLREEFDSVFIFMPDGLRRGGNFFSQLLEISESVMLIAGADATPRSELGYVRKHVARVGKPMLGLVTGASVRDVKREMEGAI